ncbi:benzyl alcohol O-benzoyltransferase-like isoform X2 [Coffea arabica]|uniref:Benzyl alcohol O-benzoyltransferase-like isoform X2 n=1 Tax=Coffea arabica TaxID=13443 RepID=A0ABM4W7G4_COFAR
MGSKPLTFRVTRQKPELVRPAKSTPRECKRLSDINDQDGLRFQAPVIQFYRSDDDHEGLGLHCTNMVGVHITQKYRETQGNIKVCNCVKASK